MSSGGARESLYYKAEKVEETNMEAEALVPLLSDCPEHFTFSSSCDIDIPSQFLWSLNRLVIPVFSFGFFVFSIL